MDRGHESRPGPTAGVERFSAYVRQPYAIWHARGFSNATLLISPGRFVVQARFRLGGWPAVEYAWPVAVVQTLRPFGGPSLLFEMTGALASCTVWWYERARLHAALERAGIVIVEENRLGWVAPRRARRETLGGRVADVPATIIADR